jgi:hypothetical protein
MKLITTGGVPIPDSEPVVFLGPWCENQEKASAGSWQFDGYATPDKRADLERLSREISESIFPDLASALLMWSTSAGIASPRLFPLHHSGVLHK